MDARVVARFYKVTEPAGARDFHDLLLAEMQEPLAGNREKDLSEGVTVRLEDCRLVDGFLEGQFCRVQTVNVPPQADENGLTPIPLGNGGLGHLAAFRYHPDSRILLLQQNVQSATPQRVSLYVAGANPAHIFHLEPVLSEDAWDRFRAGNTRAFTVRFAGADNLAALDDQDVSAAQGARMIAEAYDGVQVTIEVSVGRSRHRRLDPARVLQDLGRLVGIGATDKLTAKIEGDDQPLDLLHEHLRVQDDLDLVANDPAANYRALPERHLEGSRIQQEPVAERLALPALKHPTTDRRA